MCIRDRSHGEGRFMADEATVKMLAENGQIATQYVDLNGNPKMCIRDSHLRIKK